MAGVAMALATGAASAADLPRRAAPPPLYVPPPPPFTWTGVYFGTHTSYLFSDRQRINSVGNDPTTQALVDGGFVPALLTTKVQRLPKFGGGFGINYQLTPGSGFVVGGGLAIDWTDANKTVAFTGPPLPIAFGGFPLTTVANRQLDFLGTLNGRLGYAWDNVMVYGTGGYAFGKERFGGSVYAPGPGGPTLVATGGSGGMESGYNYGGGIEIALTKGGFFDNFDVLKLLGINLGGTSTIKAEYIRYDLGDRNVTVATLPGVPFLQTSGTSRFHTEGSIVRAGFNYKFP